MIRLRPALLGILAVGFFFGLYSEGYDRLWQAHILDRFQIPVIPWIESLQLSKDMTIVLWYAGLKIVMMLITVVAARFVENRLHHPEMPELIRGLLICSGLIILCLAGFAIAGKLIVAVILVLLIGVIREITYPIYNTWVNHRLESQVRATVLSISSQSDAIGQIAGGPVVGVIAKQISITAGLLTSSVMLTPILVLLFGQRRSPEVKDIK